MRPRTFARAPKGTVSAAAQLGPFEIDSFVGSGGMGDVYRANHDRYGTDAAIKVLTAEHARRERFVRAFQREVRALAKLDHPGIAAVYDHGVVEESARHVASPGAPWLAMEFVDGPVISSAPGINRWPVLQSVLLSLLDALAHAHAHGVIHRDLKPGNILVVGEPEEGLEIRLLDFGIARVLEEEAETDDGEEGRERVRGTPKYMAPEQILGEWRNQGPWTDLYAFGCLAWRLISGRAPFGGETTEDVLKGHIRNHPKEFTPVMEIPAGIQGWLDRLLAKRPEERFRRAADAAFALARVASDWTPETSGHEGGREGSMRSDEQFEGGRFPTLSGLEATLVDSVPTLVDDAAGGGESSSVATTPFDAADLSEITDHDVPDVAEGVPEPVAPPVPGEWRRADRSKSSRLREGASLGLFGLRKIPMVDREGERDRLWEMLRVARESKRPRAILLTGPPASGKSRLARWLSRRAHELGAATTLKATHSSNAEWSGGLGPMLDRFFRCAQLEWDEALERVQERLAELDIEATARIHDAVGLTHLMGHRPSEWPESFPGGFDTDRERNAAIRRVVRGLGRERGVLLWLDDAVWGPESLAFARSLFEKKDDAMPVFVVMTSRSEDLAEAEEGADHLRAMRTEGDLEELELTPLAGEDHHRLVERMLALEVDLAERVAEHTEGEPLFATQLLRDWVDRDLLGTGDEGYELRVERGEAPAELIFPEDLDELWTQRLEAAFASIDGLSADEGFRAVEFAAALGRQVDREEWRAVCRRAGIGRCAEIEGALVERGLAEGSGEGWYFIHAKLVAALRERARRAGRWGEVHRTCAQALAEVLPRRRDTLLRRVEHLLEAGEKEAALEPLYDAAVNCAGAGRYLEDNRLLEWRGDLMDELGVDAGDRRRVQNRIGLGTNLLHMGETDRAEQYLGDAETHCRDNEWKSEVSRLLRTKALMYGEEGDHGQAIALLREAAELCMEAGDELGRWEVEATMGWMLEQEGRDREAQEKLAAAVEHLDKEGRPGSVKSSNWLATTYLSTGEYEKAREILDDVHEEIRQAGLRAAECQEWNLRGEIARLEGDWERAKRSYERARDLAAQSGERNLAIVDMNIAMVEMASGRFRRAEREFERLLESLEEAGMSARLPRIRIGLAACAAGKGEWDRFDKRLEEAEQKAVGEGSMSYDDPWLAEFAAEYAEEAGEPEHARRAWTLVANLWKQAGDADKAAEAVERATPRTGS